MAIKKKVKKLEDDFTLEQASELHKALEMAREDDTPYALFEEDNSVSVIGDPNKTENKKTNYVILYRFRKDELEEIPNNAEIIGNFVMVTEEYNDIVLPARKDDILMDSALRCMPFFTSYEELLNNFKDKVIEIENKYNAKFVEKGTTLKDKSKNEKMLKEGSLVSSEFIQKTRKLFVALKQDVRDACYDMVATVLDIDDDLKDNMNSYSVFTAMLTIINKYAFLFNQAEAVFGV